MANLVLGVGTSHGPMLVTPPEEWHRRAQADRGNTSLNFQGRNYDFEGLVAARGTSEFEGRISLEQHLARHARVLAAVEKLGAAIDAAELDALVIVSSDHKEIFDDQVLAPFTVYWGEEIDHMPVNEASLAKMGPGLALSARAYAANEPTKLAGSPELAKAIIDHSINADFDVASSLMLPAGKHGNHAIPHGWGYVLEQVLGGRYLPVVPIFVNTFWSPTPPTARRCYAWGKAIGDAIRSWDGTARIGIVASGGLSHMVIDEAFDQRVLTALREDDAEALGAIPSTWLESGSSEIRNWIVTAGAMSGSGLEMDLVDYVPLYRSEAGTGNAAGFALWG
ncbi:hypothetical protein [Agromyces archimandritae]|uniref:Extradiol ring-cleavage dioxygenase class III enzyme subunit B domain-containing protein n=1 Tax=Agromyces archimandritae TaxID=2781962 RepID=A0A975FM13_9MICO|nr:hypothetical protein [Agromyces archimandritae]QTX04394.1 hypothetical protein G127AT_14145 [Agromyces archimandritae]